MRDSLRFEYSYKTNKPSRSIHTSCLAQIPVEHLDSSVGVLERALSGEADADAKRACSAALDVLRARR